MTNQHGVPDDIWLASVGAAKKWFGSEWDETALVCDNLVLVLSEMAEREREQWTNGSQVQIPQSREQAILMIAIAENHLSGG